MRKIKILQVTPTSTIPGSLEIAGDFTAMFRGRHYRNSAGLTQPGYSNPSAGYVAIVATSFDVIENAKYNGRYTVYSPVSADDYASSTFANTKTTIRVAEVVPVVVTGDTPSVTSDGYITNVNTYLLDIGTSMVLVPPGITLDQYPIELMGRNVSGWGEGFAQNFVNVARNFAGPTAPANPFVGQLHYDTDDKQYRGWDGTTWELLNRSSFGTTHRHTQTSASTTWTVNHNLGLATPFIGIVQAFVNRGNGPKMILPSDVTFTTANQLTVTFTAAETGWVLVRP